MSLSFSDIHAHSRRDGPSHEGIGRRGNTPAATDTKVYWTYRSGARTVRSVGIDMKAPLVAVVDDDESVRESVPHLLRELGFAARAFESASALLAAECISDVECLVIDVFMPAMTGPELHAELKKRGHTIPTVFISARADEAVKERMVDAAATPIVAKPFNETSLHDAITAALRAT